MAHRMGEHRELEGRQVCLALANGSRIDDCNLVSAGRGRVDTLWIYANGHDAFIPCADVVDVWQATPLLERRAA